MIEFEKVLNTYNITVDRLLPNYYYVIPTNDFSGAIFKLIFL